jgi:hypothetical protein
MSAERAEERLARWGHWAPAEGRKRDRAHWDVAVVWIEAHCRSRPWRGRGTTPGRVGGPLRASSVDEMSMPSTVLHPADPRWGLADQMPDCSHGTWSVATRWGDLIQKGDTEAPSGPIAIQADPRRAWVGRHQWAYARRRARESRADRQAASATVRCNQPRGWRAHASG